MLGISEQERKKLLLSIGTHKGSRPLSPVEVASLLDRVTQAGMASEELAAALYLEGTTMLGRFRRLLTLAPEVAHLVDWGTSEGTLGFSAAQELARLPSQEQQSVLAEACLRHNLSSSEVRQVVQLVLRSKRRVADCVTEVVGMRPTVEVRHVFVGSVSESLRAHLAKMTQLQRNELLQAALNSAYPKVAFPVARLGIDRFTMSGGPELAVVMGTDFEERVNSALKAESKE